jgi:hypothetical protein
MKKIFTFIIFSLVILKICFCGNTAYLKIEDQSIDPITINDGNVSIYNRGAKTGKSIFKFVKLFQSKEEYKKMAEMFEKTIICNIYLLHN